VPGCCDSDEAAALDASRRRVLRLVLAINAVMFVVEGTAGLLAGSLSLQADAVDFLGDSIAYAVSLLVIGHSLRWRASAALFKAGMMGFFGLAVLANTIHHAFAPVAPDAAAMGAVGILALAANLASAVLLFRHRGGDANMRSVWLCSRNDAVGNLAVLFAASGVAITATGWPDLAVGFGLAALQLGAAASILRQAQRELRVPAAG